MFVPSVFFTVCSYISWVFSSFFVICFLLVFAPFVIFFLFFVIVFIFWSIFRCFYYYDFHFFQMSIQSYERSFHSNGARIFFLFFFVPFEWEYFHNFQQIKSLLYETRRKNIALNFPLLRVNAGFPRYVTSCGFEPEVNKNLRSTYYCWESLPVSSLDPIVNAVESHTRKKKAAFIPSFRHTDLQSAKLS